KGHENPWNKVVVRPVALKSGRQMQFSFFDGKKDITKNHSAEEVGKYLEEVLLLPFRQIHLQSAASDIHVRISKKGKALISRGKPSLLKSEPELSHNRLKRHALPENVPDDFLHTIGIVDESGKVRSRMRGKFRQINEFLKLMEQVTQPDDFTGTTCEIVDCGCGSAYLTFAAYHYFSHVKGISARVRGIDSDEEIIEKCNSLRDSLNWDGLDFQVSKISEFVPSTPPDIVLSLHACDTATDEAIAQGILWNSRTIIAAPCCQHELHQQISAPSLQPILRHGVLKQRTADVVTDALRALVLRIMGYRTDVVEFVSPEHTSKNLMIRAVKTLKPGDMAHVKEYQDLKGFWNVSPCIEELLGDDFKRYLV
ncbi:MAG: SAM-dependent methyltransferase, partial [Chloroflexi bacterium]|nr:SAM-dependent methyltransferase [Chloroflexota bacterium]